MFGEMGERNLLLSAQLIIADLKLLSGLKLPTGDAFSRMTELLAESLKEDYPFFTVPLVKIAIKKNVSVLTAGKEKLDPVLRQDDDGGLLGRQRLRID